MSQKNLLEYSNQPLSAEDSPASHLVVQESRKESQMIDISGPNTCELSESCNQNGLWERMSQELLKSLSMTSSIVLKRKDTPRKHTVIQFRYSEPAIKGKEYSSLPTTQASEPFEKKKIQVMMETGKRYSPTGYKQPRGLMLMETLALIPTLTASEDGGGVMEIRPNCGGRYKTRDYIANLPTCTSRDYKGGTVERIEQGNPKRALDCEMQVHGLKLQPAFATWMMGFPEGWTDLNASEMPLSRSKSIRSSKPSQISKEG